MRGDCYIPRLSLSFVFLERTEEGRLDWLSGRPPHSRRYNGSHLIVQIFKNETLTEKSSQAEKAKL